MKGFSLIELVTTMAISSMILLGAAAIMARTVETQEKAKLQNSVDSLYLVGMQTARSTFQLSKRIPMDVGLSACLSGAATNPSTQADCTTYSEPRTLPVDPNNQSDKDLNARFSIEGRCEDSASPKECRLRTTTNYQWICIGTKCNGLLVSVAVEATDLEANGEVVPSRIVQPRRGSFTIPAEAFSSKAQIKFDCQSSQGLPLKGVNYNGFAANCAQVARDPDCAMPAMKYGNATAGANCQPRQQKDCGAGFGQISLFDNQANCVGAGPGYTATVVTVVNPPPPTPVPTPPPVCTNTTVSQGMSAGATPRYWGGAACGVGCQGTYGMDSRCGGSCFSGARGWIYCTQCVKDQTVCN